MTLWLGQTHKKCPDMGQQLGFCKKINHYSKCYSKSIIFKKRRTLTQKTLRTIALALCTLFKMCRTSAGMCAFMTRNDTLTAEIWWALKANSSYYSYKSCEDKNVLVQQIFPDSDTANNFQQRGTVQRQTSRKPNRLDL